MLCCAVLSHSVVSDSLQPCGLQSTMPLWSWGFSRQEYWSGLPYPPPGDLPNWGIEPRSPTLQGDALLSETPEKPVTEYQFHNIQKLNSTLLNNQWVKKDITMGIRKYFEMNENENIIYKTYEMQLKQCLCCAVLSRSVVPDSLQPHGLQPAWLLCPWGFSSQEYWSGLPCPPPGDLPNPGIKPRSPMLQADSSLSEPPGNLKNTEVGSLTLLQGIVPTQEQNWVLLHCRWILYQLSYQGSPKQCLEENLQL